MMRRIVPTEIGDLCFWAGHGLCFLVSAPNANGNVLVQMYGSGYQTFAGVGDLFRAEEEHVRHYLTEHEKRGLPVGPIREPNLESARATEAFFRAQRLWDQGPI